MMNRNGDLGLAHQKRPFNSTHPRQGHEELIVLACYALCTTSHAFSAVSCAWRTQSGIPIPR